MKENQIQRYQLEVSDQEFRPSVGEPITAYQKWFQKNYGMDLPDEEKRKWRVNSLVVLEKMSVMTNREFISEEIFSMLFSKN